MVIDVSPELARIVALCVCLLFVVLLGRKENV